MDQKTIIQNFYREFFNEHRIEAADQYVVEDYIQHNPHVEQGREGLKRTFTSKFQEEPDFHLEIQMLIEEKDKMVVYLNRIDADGRVKAHVVDIYRMKDGLLYEHWDVLQAL